MAGVAVSAFDWRAFNSSLTVDEHHALRVVGFVPVGQVMGNCVFQTGYTARWDCGYNRRAQMAGAFGQVFQTDFLRVPQVAPVREVPGRLRILYEVRQRALDRMRQQCAGLGGDGVVAVRLTTAPFPAGGLEFRAIGTAVRAAGDVRPQQPFMSDLTGQDFAKLIMAGWVPCGLVMGLAVMIRHDDWQTQSQASSWRNVEMSGHTKLIKSTRASARDRLREGCLRCGGAGVVIHTMTLNLDKRRCLPGEEHDHVAEAMMIGTAITPFRHAGSAPPASLPIMRLR